MRSKFYMLATAAAISLTPYCASCETDADGDGYNADRDCDDNDPNVYPGAMEYCDGKDNDCDGKTDDEDEWIMIDEPQDVWYYDGDQDGFGDAGNTIKSCTAPEKYTRDNTDCDDTDVSISPNGVEICDGKDNDCDGLYDDADPDTANSGTPWYPDGDNDTYGDDNGVVYSCAQPPNHTDRGGDCDDREPTANPEGTEVCDGFDNDCNGTVDDIDFGKDSTEGDDFYADQDGDGFGSATDWIRACTQPDGHTTDNTDCEDTDAAINPNAEEICDGKDNDCDGTIDGGTGSPDQKWYKDADGDGQGTQADVTTGCFQPDGYAPTPDDCDDNDASIFQGAPELCDGKANNCTQQNGWNPSAEQGTATYFGADGTAQDVSGDFEQTASKFQETPNQFTPDQDGELALCGSFYGQVFAQNVAVDIYGYTQDAALDAAGQGRVIEAHDATVQLGQLSIRNGAVDGDGAGLFAVRSSVAAQDVTFYGNQASGKGGGAYVQDGDNAQFVQSTFQENDADAGGGLYVDGSQQAAIARTTFFRNEAFQSGGGAAFVDTTYLMTLADFQQNQATAQQGYGGAVWSQNASGDLLLSTVKNNAAAHGAAFSVDQADLDMGRTQVSQNTAWQYGSAIESTGNATVSAKNSWFQHNVSAEDHAWNSTVFIDADAAGSFSQTQFQGNVNPSGNLFYATQDAGQLDVTQCDLSQSNGGTVQNYDQNYDYGQTTQTTFTCTKGGACN